MARRSFTVLLLVIAAAIAWRAAGSPDLFRMIREAVVDRSPRDEYLQVMERSGLADTALGQAWMAAADRALGDLDTMSAGFARSQAVTAREPAAFAYQVTIRRGQRLDVVATLDGEAPGEVFVDIFAAANLETPLESTLQAARIEADSDDRFVLRVQPELLRGGRLHVAGYVGPALRFPVEGAGAKHLQSIFGDPRDAGARAHEGVDIFATRGTPVLAASDGLVTRVAETGIGGRVVWVWDLERSLHLYYAHLDEQLIGVGARVRSGDLIGTVGNTGNARTTAPHLHFGIYEPGHGAIDPDAFIRPTPAIQRAHANSLSRSELILIAPRVSARQRRWRGPP